MYPIQRLPSSFSKTSLGIVILVQTYGVVGVGVWVVVGVMVGVEVIVGVIVGVRVGVGVGVCV